MTVLEPNPPPGETGFVQARTLVLMRWVAVAAQAGAVSIVHYGFGYTVPLIPAYATVGASVLVNLFASLHRSRSAGLSERQAFGFLAFDTVQLTVLLQLTGGLQNPFALLILAPVTVGATVLSRGTFIGLAVLAASAATVLALWHMPLPWDGPPPDMPGTLVLGAWVATTVAIAFMVVYVGQVAIEGRRRSDALAATQDALAREQRIADLGALAAAAAHELGTPLATITVIAKELAREVPPDGALAEDARLLESQAERCKAILTEFSRHPDMGGDADGFLSVPLTALVRDTAEPYRRANVELAIVGRAQDDTPEPMLMRRPELVNGLGNILSNAQQFARTRVDVAVIWNGERVVVRVRDDGHGFRTSVLMRLGEPYLSTRRGSDGHMGLGIFIARTLLERNGAEVSFRNRARRGAEVEIRWPRAILEQRIREEER